MLIAVRPTAPVRHATTTYEIVSFIIGSSPRKLQAARRPYFADLLLEDDIAMSYLKSYYLYSMPEMIISIFNAQLDFASPSARFCRVYDRARLQGDRCRARMMIWGLSFMRAAPPDADFTSQSLYRDGGFDAR